MNENYEDYYAWVLEPYDFLINEINIDRIIHDGHSHVILDGNIRVDIWHDNLPQTDIHKEARELWNNVKIPYIDEILDILAKTLKTNACNHTYSKYKDAIRFIENKYYISICMGDAIKYARINGGFCDCEILINHG